MKLKKYKIKTDKKGIYYDMRYYRHSHSSYTINDDDIRSFLKNPITKALWRMYKDFQIGAEGNPYMPNISLKFLRNLKNADGGKIPLFIDLNINNSKAVK